MKAIVVENFGGPEVLKLREAPDLKPSSEQLLVRLHAAGVNPVDTYIRAGAYARLPQLPYTPGFDGAGVIEAVGSSVRGYRRGQRVYLSGSLTGTYAQYCLALPSHLHTLPNQVSFQEGACIGVAYATASYALLHRLGLKKGQTVLVHGATGGVGIAAVQLARRAGLRILATGGSEAGRLLLEAQGAHAVFDHHQPGYENEILAFTEGQGVNGIVEMLANVNLGRDLPMLAQGGSVAVVGCRGPVQIQPRELMTREGEIRGVMLAQAPPGIFGRVHTDLHSGLTNGSLRPVIRTAFELDQAADAHELQMQPGAAGKLILVTNSEASP